MGIVEEIQTAVKALLPALTNDADRGDGKQLDYEYNIDLNSDRGYTNRFGFIPGNATFAEGRAMGSTTMNHTFTLILTDDFQNKDDDTAQNTALLLMYKKVQDALKELQKSKLALPTPTNQVLLISGLTLDDPIFNEDSTIAALRANFVIQYRYRNN